MRLMAGESNGDSGRTRYDAGSNGAYASRAVVAMPDGATHEVRTEDFVPWWIRNSGRGRE